MLILFHTHVVYGTNISGNNAIIFYTCRHQELNIITARPCNATLGHG